jgi:hypothetical protein
MIELLAAHGAQHHTGTPIHILLEACSRGDLAQVMLLEKAGGDLGAVDYDKRSGLHLSCAGGHLHLVKYLLEKDVDVDCVDAFDRTPLDEARLHGRVEAERLLRKHGAVRDTYSTTKLLAASDNDSTAAAATNGQAASNNGTSSNDKHLAQIAASVSALTAKLGAKIERLEGRLDHSDARMSARMAQSDSTLTAAMEEMIRRFQDEQASQHRRVNMLTMPPSRGGF